MQGATVASETHKNALKAEEGREEKYQPCGSRLGNQAHGGNTDQDKVSVAASEPRLCRV